MGTQTPIPIMEGHGEPALTGGYPLTRKSLAAWLRWRDPGGDRSQVIQWAGLHAHEAAGLDRLAANLDRMGHPLTRKGMGHPGWFKDSGLYPALRPTILDELLAGLDLRPDAIPALVQAVGLAARGEGDTLEAELRRRLNVPAPASPERLHPSGFPRRGKGHDSGRAAFSARPLPEAPTRSTSSTRSGSVAHLFRREKPDHQERPMQTETETPEGVRPSLSPVEEAIWTEMQRRGYALANPVYADQKRELAAAAGSTSAGVSVALAGIRKKLGGFHARRAPGSATPSENGKNGHHAAPEAAPHQDRARDAPEPQDAPCGPIAGTTAEEPDDDETDALIDDRGRLAAMVTEAESVARIAVGERDGKAQQAEYRRLETALRETQQALDAAEDRIEALEAGELLPVPEPGDLSPGDRRNVVDVAAKLAAGRGFIDLAELSAARRCAILARALYLVRRELCFDGAGGE